MSWFAANDYCKSVGAKLAEINSREENQAIVAEIIRGGYKKNSMFFWVGLTDKDKEGTWKLASNGADADYLNWDKSFAHNPEPNNHNGSEDCAHIRTGPCGNWKDEWADLNCNEDGVRITCTRSTSSKSAEYSMHALCEFGAQPCKVNSSATGEKEKKKYALITYFFADAGADVPVSPILGSVALGVFLVTSFLFMYKRQNSRKLAENVTDIDENPTYGDYYDPNPVMEVEDSNDYYSSTVYEADTSRTTDNNSQYGD